MSLDYDKKNRIHSIECDSCGDVEEADPGLSHEDAMEDFKKVHGFANKFIDGQWKNLCSSCKGQI